MKRHCIRTRSRHRNGATIVEFALVLPVLLALLIGIIEFGWMIKNHLTIANATREGARAAAVGKSTSEIQSRISAMAAPLPVTSPNGSILMQYSADSGTTYMAWPADYNNQNGVLSGNLVKITVTTRHRPLTGFFPFLNNRNIQVNVTMRREA